MGFLRFSNKREVPDELPEITVESSKIQRPPIITENKILDEPKIEEIKSEYDEEKNNLNQIDALVNSKKEGIKFKEDKPQKDYYYVEEGFFNELQTDLLNEVDNLNKLEKWYNNKFLPEDVVSEMKGYWEAKKKDSITKILGRGFQERVSKKIDELQELEKEWQRVYFNLIEKEEEIKDKEKELKKELKEFIELCKKRKMKK